MNHPYDAFRARVAPLVDHRPWSPADGPLPPLFLSHGAPPLLEDAGWMDDLFAWARSLPRPRAVLIVSAHWESAPVALSSPQVGTPLVYDFSGFDPRYFRLQYRTPDASALARLVRATLPSSEDVHEHPTRGLDHGAWVPLLAMYPEADVPVLQLSLPTHDPARLLDLGARLRPLREQGVLVIGSGFTTHGLRFLTRAAWAGLEVPSWSREFDAWAAEAMARGDVDELAAFRERAPGMPYAHPTVEHFSPLFVTLGAADQPDAPVRTTIDGYFFGLARRSVQAA
jgi:4,5-DOPA dioxygenase extradiol